LRGIYRDLLKHSSVYGVGQILSRLASFLLLPLYTRYLHRADYGCIAILDLTTVVLAILIGGGMAQAVNRYHFDANNERERDQVWWSGLTFILLVSLAFVIPAWYLRDYIAEWTLPGEANGSYYYSLVLPTLLLGMVAELPSTYLRVQKWSGIFVSLSLGRLLLNIALNVYFLVYRGWGVAGVLTGNLICQAVSSAILLGILACTRGRYVFYSPIVRKLLIFASPLVLSALLSTITQRANSYFLEYFCNRDDVGLYSLAFQIGQGMNSFFIMPFASIWGVAIYEIAKQPNPKAVYVRVFNYFIYGLMLLMFGVSLFARPLLRIMATSEYEPAANLIPVICLAYVFFSMHDHFRIPVLLSKRTTTLLPAYFVAAFMSIVLNLSLIPLFGMAGAAWASVFAFMAFSFTGLWLYRRVDRYNYPLLRCGSVLAGMAISLLVCRGLDRVLNSFLLSFGLMTLVWLAWAVALFGRDGYRLLLIRFPSAQTGSLELGTPQTAQSS